MTNQLSGLRHALLPMKHQADLGRSPCPSAHARLHGDDVGVRLSDTVVHQVDNGAFSLVVVVGHDTENQQHDVDAQQTDDQGEGHWVLVEAGEGQMVGFEVHVVNKAIVNSILYTSNVCNTLI